MKKSTKIFKVSDPSMNVYQMRVRTSGIMIEDFLKNPVCLLNHNYDKVIGNWEDLSVVGEDMSAVPVLDDDDPEAKLIGDKIERNLIKGASIGIIPLAVEGDEITKCDLLEISLTPVPANRNALVIYNAKGVALNAQEAKSYMLSVSTNEQNIKPVNLKESMNDKQRMAFIALCMQAGLTLNLSAASTDEEVTSAMQKVGEKITALNLSVEQLKSVEIIRKNQEEAAQKIAVATRVDLAITNKVITADKRDAFIQLGAANAQLLNDTLDGLNPVNLSAEIPGQKDSVEKQVEAADRAAWSFKDFLEKDGAALSAMQAGDPSRFNKLYSNYQVQLKASGAIA